MSYSFDSQLGKQLYRLLPEIYRMPPELYRLSAARQQGQDGEQGSALDLAKFLDAHGHLLDLIHATLEQQLKDVFPLSSQEWLLPYFAELLAADIVSPDAAGKHAEVAHAISWRQRKGTLRCVEEIGEAVAQMEVEIQEGWQRVAVTPRIGMTRMDSTARDSELQLDMTIPAEASRHPDLPAAMLDMRAASRAVKAELTNPAAQISRFGGVRLVWRQRDHHGVPCSPGSFDDVSRRTVDMRTPTASQGHFHHKRLLAYAPPPLGFFHLPPITLEWSERNDDAYRFILEEKVEDGRKIIRNLTNRQVEIVDEATLVEPALYVIEGLCFRVGLVVAAGGSVELNRVVAERVEVASFSTEEPVLTARQSVFGILSVGSGLAVLQDCTVVEEAFFSSVEAENSILQKITGTELGGFFSYCRIPVTVSTSSAKLVVNNCTTDEPVYFNHQTELRARTVLGPNCPRSIYAGADDGGEMGYFHRGRRVNPVVLQGDFTDGDSLLLSAEGSTPLRDLVFTGSVEVENGGLHLIRVAMQSLQVNTQLASDTRGNVIPSLDARDCLFDTVKVDPGLARLEYCTVMQLVHCRHLQASDCVFAGSIEGVEEMSPTEGAPVLSNCIRYSSIIPAILSQQILGLFRLVDGAGALKLGTNIGETPNFTSFAFCQNNVLENRTPLFGDPGYGVLAASTPASIRFGAEDGGEMGGYHHKFYSLKQEATRVKMREFLPVNIEPVLIQDARLLYVWPELLTSEDST